MVVRRLFICVLIMSTTTVMAADRFEPRAVPSQSCPSGWEANRECIPDISPLPVTITNQGYRAVAGTIPSNDPTFQAKVNLGKQLFFDTRLSTVNWSCASCHIPIKGYTDQKSTPPLRSNTHTLRAQRNTPALYNVSLNQFLFWDGRAGSLEKQVADPILGEMKQTRSGLVQDLLDQCPEYRENFKIALGSVPNEGNIVEMIGQAIAAFERTIVSNDSPFDRSFRSDPSTVRANPLESEGRMSEKAKNGMKWFKGRGRCILCHYGPNFTDNKFHNLGVPKWDGADEDLGRYNETRNDIDRGAFKTPTLRNVAKTFTAAGKVVSAGTHPYMHNGKYQDLDSAIEFLKAGGDRQDAHLDPLIQPLDLNPQQTEELIEFLNALSGEDMIVEQPSLPCGGS